MGTVHGNLNHHGIESPLIMRFYNVLLAALALLAQMILAQTPLDSRTANTETAEISTVSPTESTQSTATTSVSRTANTIVAGPTTVTDTSTAAGQGQTDTALAAPTARPMGLVGAAVVIGVGMVI